MKGVSILGSTGSIGKNTLEVIQHFPQKFKVIGLAAKSNIDLLEEQIRQFEPLQVSVDDPKKAEILSKKISNLKYRKTSKKTEILVGIEGVKEIASNPQTEIVVSCMVGAAGLLPTLEAVKSKKRVLLANKEVLVMAGEPFTDEVKKNKCEVIPVDSEHSAIFQCIEGKNYSEISKLILTASGGPFLNKKKKDLGKVTCEEALNHPNWKMGKKITIDSATMMNKGLELIEAFWLFGLEEKNIEVVIHPQSIVHSLVEFIDGSVLAQLGVPDMKIPIQYALSYPRRIEGPAKKLDLTKIETLNFMGVDDDKFPSINLAREALRSGGCMPAVLNASNEIAVARFLEGKIKFLQIFELVEEIMGQLKNQKTTNIENILEADRWARQEAIKWKA